MANLNLKWTKRASKPGGWELHRADRQCLSWWSGLGALWARANRAEPSQATHFETFPLSVFGLFSSHAVSYVSLVLFCWSDSAPRLSSDKWQTRPGRPEIEKNANTKSFQNKFDIGDLRKKVCGGRWRQSIALSIPVHEEVEGCEVKAVTHLKKLLNVDANDYMTGLKLFG